MNFFNFFLRALLFAPITTFRNIRDDGQAFPDNFHTTGAMAAAHIVKCRWREDIGIEALNP